MELVLLEATELFELLTELATELTELFDELDITEELLLIVEHTAPVTAGFSAAPLFFSPCTPKLIDCPG